MKSKKSSSILSSSTVVFLLTLLAGCKGLELDSEWRDCEIDIDGAAAEWQGVLTFDEETRCSIGVFNDERYLFLCFTSLDRGTAFQMAGLGFTAWFDPKGGRQKTFGIHFPLGIHKSGQAVKDRQGMPDPKAYSKVLEDLGTEVEIVGPAESQRIREPLVSIEGIEVKLAHWKGLLVYELKVPLGESEEHPYDIGTDPGKMIGIGFVTSEPDRETMGQGRRGKGGTGPRDGGMGGRPPGGGRRGGMGGRRPDGGMPEPLELWAKVTLASGRSPAQD